MGKGQARPLNSLGMTKLFLEKVAQQFLEEQVSLEYEQREIAC